MRLIRSSLASLDAFRRQLRAHVRLNQAEAARSLASKFQTKTEGFEEALDGFVPLNLARALPSAFSNPSILSMAGKRMRQV